MTAKDPDNTIDSEIDKLIDEIGGDFDDGVPYDENARNHAGQTIKKLIAQEANKTRVDIITRALLANPTQDHMLRLWLEDSLELLTADKEQNNG